MSWNRLLRRLAIGLLVVLPFEAGCGEDGGSAAPATGGAGIPGVRGPAATPKAKGAAAARGRPAPKAVE